MVRGVKDGEGGGGLEKIRKDLESMLGTLDIMLKITKTLKGFKRVSDMIIISELWKRSLCSRMENTLDEAKLKAEESQ